MTVENIIGQVRDFYEKSDVKERRKLVDELDELQTSFLTDWDIMARLFTGPLQASLAKMGTDLHIFGILVASDKPVTLTDLAEKTGAHPSLLMHVLHTQASFKMIRETGTDEFAANRICKVLADPNVAGAMDHFYDFHFPVEHAMPSFFKDNKYQPITSNKNLPFHKALKTDLPPFEWMQQHPEQMKALGHGMAMQRTKSWIDSYPIDEEVGNFQPSEDSAMLVDIGGGFGQQAIAFKQKFPNLPGQVIDQDISATLSKAPPAEGVKFMVQDFFQPQAVKGAKFYYLRHVMHDWPDDDCVRILKGIVPAMGPGSRIVIDEIVLPDVNAPWQSTFMDMAMMCAFGGVERSEAEWKKLLDQAGLKILDIHKYDPKMQSVILAIPK